MESFCSLSRSLLSHTNIFFLFLNFEPEIKIFRTMSPSFEQVVWLISLLEGSFLSSSTGPVEQGSKIFNNAKLLALVQWVTKNACNKVHLYVADEVGLSFQTMCFFWFLEPKLLPISMSCAWEKPNKKKKMMMRSKKGKMFIGREQSRPEGLGP